jgi:hypothetical protein
VQSPSQDFPANALLLIAGSAAIKLSERLQARSTLAKTLLLVYGFVNHWTASLRIVFKPLLYAHKVGMQTGEVRREMDYFPLCHASQFRRHSSHKILDFHLID